jgi:hypothetical protein
MKTGLESLDTGAPEITYSGNEGPKSPQQMQQIQRMQMAQLEEEYDAYVDDMIEQGIEPMSMRQFLEQIAAEAQMSSNEEGIGGMMEDPREMAAFGGIMGVDGRRQYGGGSDMGAFGGFGYQGGGTNQKGTKGTGPGVDTGGAKGNTGGEGDKAGQAGYSQHTVTGYTGPTNYGPAQPPQERIGGVDYNVTPENKQERDDARAKNVIAKKNKTDTFINKKPKKTTVLSFLSGANKRNREYFINNVLKAGFVPGYADLYDDDFDIEEAYDSYMANRLAGKTDAVGRPVEGFSYDTKTGELTGNFIDNRDDGRQAMMQQQAGLPPNTETPASEIPVSPITGQYSNQYLIPGASNFYSNLPSTAFNPTTNMLTLADGGRANFAGGGIADLRQGYFLGKLVKSITKPFKKAFRGFKKIAKSPMGKMALLALGGYYMGGGSMLGGKSMFGGQGFGTSKLANLFTSKGTALKNFLSPDSIGGDKVFPKLMNKNNVVKLAKNTVDPSGNFFTRALSSAFKPENAFTTIAGISGLSGLYTNYINNKREDESMADYQRRLEIERGNFAPIPVDPVQFAANGGRMGFADGGDDDDDEDFRQKALGALYQKLAMGGSAGMPPVTMMSEGQDIQSFGDDESTGMPQATPTMPNQMPMRPPMMDPRMQQQMMMQRGNPMMNRGMMSMQQPPRIMAQEGGMMDMGGMEKDYRNEGGFVAIGGQERADDVPARLSKNEFVFTADAVRNAGGGDIDKGAEIMENMMENLEAGGKVSEASQGLSGARQMFQTSQRLEEVL